jgi:hypothetical protein
MLIGFMWLKTCVKSSEEFNREMDNGILYKAGDLTKSATIGF